MCLRRRWDQISKEKVWRKRLLLVCTLFVYCVRIVYLFVSLVYVQSLLLNMRCYMAEKIRRIQTYCSTEPWSKLYLSVFHCMYALKVKMELLLDITSISLWDLHLIAARTWILLGDLEISITCCDGSQVLFLFVVVRISATLLNSLTLNKYSPCFSFPVQFRLPEIRAVHFLIWRGVDSNGVLFDRITECDFVSNI